MVEGKSQKSKNIIGVSILAAGAFLFLVVAYVAYQKIYTPSENREAQKQNKQSLQKHIVVNRAERGRVGKVNKKTYKRQKSILDKEVLGLWEAKLKSGKAVLEIEDGVYRLIVMPARTRIRYYSNGYYKITNDLIMLAPNSKWGAPKEGNYDYRSLTSAKMPVVAAKYKGKLIWQVPPKDVGIYVPPHHAVLDLVEDRILVWRALK